MYDLVVKNRFGYYELKEKPTPDELEKYYAEQYYQGVAPSYQLNYTPDEIRYIYNKIERKHLLILKLFRESVKKAKFIDIGCGEGWALQFYRQKSWDVVGLDYSEFGCKAHNPDCMKFVRVGDIFNNLKILVQEGIKFDYINMDNIFEHVLDPLQLLIDLQKIVASNGVLVIEVPNDFSVIQKYLYKNQYISKPFWIAVPDHISYFNKDGLIALCNEAEWQCKYLMASTLLILTCSTRIRTILRIKRSANPAIKRGWPLKICSMTYRQRKLTNSIKALPSWDWGDR